MCIIFFDYNPSSKSSPDTNKRYQLVIASNRDEYYDRPTLPAHFWTDPGREHVIAGKDTVSGGSWIGMTKQGRLAFLTNFRKKFNSPLFEGKSRGSLVLDYLTDTSLTPSQYTSQVLADHSQYDGFNLVVGNISEGLVYCSNRHEKGACPLEGGVYGLSNAFLDTPWSKVSEGKKKFQEILDQQLEQDQLIEELMKLLNDETNYYPDAQVYHNEFPEHWMKGLCSIFVRVKGEQYGTRSNTVILVDKEGVVTYVERTMKEPITIESSCTWITTIESFKIQN